METATIIFISILCFVAFCVLVECVVLNLGKSVDSIIDAKEAWQKYKNKNKAGKWEKWKVFNDPYKGKATFVGLCSKCGHTTEFVIREEHSHFLPYMFCPKCGRPLEQMTMDEVQVRAIDADELKKKECSECQFHTEECPADCGVMERIDSIPTIDATRHGKWINDGDVFDPYSCHCSECGNGALTESGTMYEYVASKYCPCCGARMDGAVID